MLYRRMPAVSVMCGCLMNYPQTWLLTTTQLTYHVTVSVGPETRRGLVGSVIEVLAAPVGISRPC